MQLKRQIEGGALMGLSHALHEEMAFDESGVTSRDWQTYPILTMAEVPEIKVVILSHPEIGSAGGGSEAANALAITSDCHGVPSMATGRPATQAAASAGVGAGDAEAGEKTCEDLLERATGIEPV